MSDPNPNPDPNPETDEQQKDPATAPVPGTVIEHHEVTGNPDVDRPDKRKQHDPY